MKTLLVLSIVIEVFLVLLAFSPVFVDRQKTARAVVERHNNPTPENKAALQKEMTTTQSIRVETQLCLFGLIVLNTWGMTKLIHRVRSASKSVSPSVV